MPAVPQFLSHRGVEMKNKGMTDQEVILYALEQAQRILADYMEPSPLFRAEFTLTRLSRPNGPCARTRAPKGKVRAAAGEMKEARQTTFASLILRAKARIEVAAT